MTFPGVAPVTAVALAALAPPAETFERGRDFAAWVGLTPLQHSIGGKQKLGSTSNSLLSMNRQRRTARRVYGLVLLAEIKAIQRGLLRYSASIQRYSTESPELSSRLRHQLALWRHDLSVYANSSGRIGLFSVRTAIEIIEFYHRIRLLDALIGELEDRDLCTPEIFAQWVNQHQETLRRARLHGRYLSRPLLRDVPATWPEILIALRSGRLRRPLIATVCRSPSGGDESRAEPRKSGGKSSRDRAGHA